ncbi:MFS transporter [Alicyclobacillus sp. TC]|uniref:MDR family MFS transporter n=1 Tax=Alicyclobacillus sp. TC TaxID=2606450 RepID=UPI0019321E5D|nr:MFS transporter [Alicyclobacillus sp. TC]QRF24323.1 MFS transporter [Alicyclobacillus sp. TC]
MVWWRNQIPQLHPVVWFLIAGTGFTRFAQFMVMPFLALYMSHETQASPAVIGLAVGSAPLVGTLFGLFSGIFSDKIGRKRFMLFGMLLGTVAMIGFANARSVVAFIVFSSVNGLVRPLFEPSAQATIADFTPADMRGAAFALRYWAINVGAAVGPLVGAWLGTVSSGWTFYITASVDALYVIFLLVKVPANIQSMDVQQPISTGLKTPSPLQLLGILGRDRAFLIFLLAVLTETFGYAQINSTLPESLAMHYTVSVSAHIFSLLVFTNAVEVVVCQWFIHKSVQRLSALSQIVIGQILFAAGYALFGILHSLPGEFLGMVVLTFGEICSFPPRSRYIAEIAPLGARATYYGASSLSSFGFFLGPWLGGVVLRDWGDAWMFRCVAMLVLAGVPLFLLSHYIRKLHVSVAENTPIQG